jgi:hypothetical protein
MTMLRTCERDGCDTKTLGRLCVEHEPASREPRASIGGETTQSHNAADSTLTRMSAVAGGWRCYLPAHGEAREFVLARTIS